MTILSNKKQSQTSPNSEPPPQQQQAAASTTTSVTATTPVTTNSSSTSSPSNNNNNNSKQQQPRLVSLVNDNKNDENLNNSIGNKSPIISSSSSSASSSPSCSSSPISSSITTSPLITNKSENISEIIIEPTPTQITSTNTKIIDNEKQNNEKQTENNNNNNNKQTTLQEAEYSQMKKSNRNKNNKRKIRTNHNIPMPLPPPHQRQRNNSQTTSSSSSTSSSITNAFQATELGTKIKSQDNLNYSTASIAVAAAAATTTTTIGSLTCLNNSGDENRLLMNDSDDDDDDDSDFDNSDFDLNINNPSSDRDDFNDENNYLHLHQQPQHLHFINHHHHRNNLHHHHNHHHIHHHHHHLQQQQQQQQQQQHQQQNRLVLDQENEPVLSTMNRNHNNNTNNKPNKNKKKNKKNTSNNNIFNNNTNINTKRNSIKENIKKENDYLNNNSEDEYENRPIMVSGLGSYTNNNNNNNNNSISNDNKNAIASQNLINADTLEELEVKFCELIKEKKGFVIRPMKEDGACLFRAVADQIYGDEEMHSTIRSHCMDYIAKNADYFKQYMTEDVNRYISRKRQDNCHGNHIEIIAIAEIYNRPIEVYEYSVEPKNTFQGVFQTDNEPIRLSYHGRNHYNSVVDPFKATIGVGLGLPQMTPGLAEKNLINEALKKSEEFHLEQTMLDDKLKATDWEATNEEIMELVARESYLQWLKDNEKRSMDRNSLNLYCDQIPSNQNAHCSTWEQNNSNFMGVSSSRGDTSQLYHQHNNNNNRLHTLHSHHSSTTTTSNQPRSPSQSKLSNQLKTSPLNSKSNDTLIMLNSNDEKNQIKNTLISTNTNSANNNNNNIPTTSNNKQQPDNNLFMYDENMQYYETKSIINELPPDLFGLNTTDWIGIDNANEGSDSDILAQVLAASQMEYLESLKAKRQSSKNN